MATRAVLRTFADVGERPWGIDRNADGSVLYTANGPGANVSVIDVASGKVTRHIDTGGSPWGLVVH